MAFEHAVEVQLAGAMIDLARELKRTVPAPKEAPYFGVDCGLGYDLQVFDALRERGIFRKYEFALDIGARLGGRARWIAARLGCRVLGLESKVELVAAAGALNRWAHCDAQVSFQVGSVDAMPLRDRVFTHVWWLSATSCEYTSVRLGEALRVLRRGGHFALYCTLSETDMEAAIAEQVAAAGFFEIETRVATLHEIPHSSRVAAARLKQSLRSQPEVLRRWQAMSAPRSDAVLQLFARRPA